MRKPTAPKKNPEFYRWYLRLFFIGHLMGSSRYQAAVSDLMAEWKALTTDRPDLSSVARFHDLPAPEHIDDPLNAYITRVRSIVANTLRCRVNRAPADWVCHALHEAACGRPPSQPDELSPQAQPETIVRMALDVVVFASGFGWVQTLKDSYPIGDPITIKDQPFSAFTSWEQLRKAAHERVDTTIDLMQAEVDSAISSWPRPYAKGDKTRTEETMPKLVARLVEGEQMIEGDRAQTNTLLKELGLDSLKSMRPDSPEKS